MLARGFEDESDLLAESATASFCLALEYFLLFFAMGSITYVPERKRNIMTNACGKRTFVP